MLHNSINGHSCRPQTIYKLSYSGPTDLKEAFESHCNDAVSQTYNKLTEVRGTSSMP
jgi:hypothetical protein